MKKLSVFFLLLIGQCVPTLPMQYSSQALADTNPALMLGKFFQYAEQNNWIYDKSSILSAEAADEMYQELSVAIRLCVEQFNDATTRKSRPYRRAIFFEGPPGIGKSTYGFAIGKKFNIATIMMPATDLVDSYKNSGPQKVKEVLAMAKAENKPIILIIDEISSLLDRVKQDNNPDHGILQRLFQEIDNLEGTDVLVIATYNELKDMDESFYSRYNASTFSFNFPSQKAQMIVINHLKGKYNFDPSIDDKDLLGLMKGFNFREIQDMVNHALALGQPSVGALNLHKMIRLDDLKITSGKVREQKASSLKKVLIKASTFCKDHQAIIGCGMGLAAILGGAYYYYGNYTLTKYMQELNLWKEAEISRLSTTNLALIPFIGNYAATAFRNNATAKVNKIAVDALRTGIIPVYGSTQ